jgi:hypothetical protein
MHLTPADQLAILRGHAWSTGLDDYAFLQSIRFCTDCSGNMQQGDGQVVKIEVQFLSAVCGSPLSRVLRHARVVQSQGARVCADRRKRLSAGCV